MEKKRPLLSIRPHFDPGLAMVQSLMFTAVGFVVVTIVAGMLTALLMSIVGLGKYVGMSVFGFYMVVSIAGIPPLFYELKKRAFQRTLYNFYEDYVDFQHFQWYLNRRRGRVWYRDLADITQHATALQEHQRLTTIYLYVPNMSGYNQRGFSGLKLEDLQQSKGYLTKLMDVLEMRNTGVLPLWARRDGATDPAPRPMFDDVTPPPGGFALPPEAYGAAPAEPAAATADPALPQK
ncbi:MAG TPA: hypothetical protein VEF76_12565 [Patescibacteria group bacterium]|nr:hypothetical protein [Patescibacteria group bacterium]